MKLLLTIIFCAHFFVKNSAFSIRRDYTAIHDYRNLLSYIFNETKSIDNEIFMDIENLLGYAEGSDENVEKIGNFLIQFVQEQPQAPFFDEINSEYRELSCEDVQQELTILLDMSRHFIMKAIRNEEVIDMLKNLVTDLARIGSDNFKTIEGIIRTLSENYEAQNHIFLMIDALDEEIQEEVEAIAKYCRNQDENWNFEFVEQNVQQEAEEMEETVKSNILRLRMENAALDEDQVAQELQIEAPDENLLPENVKEYLKPEDVLPEDIQNQFFENENFDDKNFNPEEIVDENENFGNMIFENQIHEHEIFENEGREGENFEDENVKQKKLEIENFKQLNIENLKTKNIDVKNFKNLELESENVGNDEKGVEKELLMPENPEADYKEIINKIVDDIILSKIANQEIKSEILNDKIDVDYLDVQRDMGEWNGDFYVKKDDENVADENFGAEQKTLVDETKKLGAPNFVADHDNFNPENGHKVILVVDIPHLEDKADSKRPENVENENFDPKTETSLLDGIDFENFWKDVGNFFTNFLSLNDNPAENAIESDRNGKVFKNVENGENLVDFGENVEKVTEMNELEEIVPDTAENDEKFTELEVKNDEFVTENDDSHGKLSNNDLYFEDQIDAQEKLNLNEVIRKADKDMRKAVDERKFLNGRLEDFNELKLEVDENENFKAENEEKTQDEEQFGPEILIEDEINGETNDNQDKITQDLRADVEIDEDAQNQAIKHKSHTLNQQKEMVQQLLALNKNRTAENDQDLTEIPETEEIQDFEQEIAENEEEIDENLMEMDEPVTNLTEETEIAENAEYDELPEEIPEKPEEIAEKPEEIPLNEPEIPQINKLNTIKKAYQGAPLRYDFQSQKSAKIDEKIENLDDQNQWMQNLQQVLNQDDTEEAQFEGENEEAVKMETADLLDENDIKNVDLVDVNNDKEVIREENYRNVEVTDNIEEQNRDFTETADDKHFEQVAIDSDEFDDFSQLTVPENDEDVENIEQKLENDGNIQKQVENPRQQQEVGEKQKQQDILELMELVEQQDNGDLKRKNENFDETF